MPRGTPSLGFSTTFRAGLGASDEPGQKPLAQGWEWSEWVGTSSQNQRLRGGLRAAPQQEGKQGCSFPYQPLPSGAGLDKAQPTVAPGAP